MISWVVTNEKCTTAMLSSYILHVVITDSSEYEIGGASIPNFVKNQLTVSKFEEGPHTAQ
jgi:hypothetical protein